jgi:hypothetical protein
MVHKEEKYYKYIQIIQELKMALLPNGDLEKLKVYPNEYINNITINRGIVRLLENDIYLLKLITGGVLVPPPTSSSDPGELGDKAIDNAYVYFHNGTQWGRIALDTSF